MFLYLQLTIYICLTNNRKITVDFILTAVSTAATGHSKTKVKNFKYFVEFNLIGHKICLYHISRHSSTTFDRK